MHGMSYRREPRGTNNDLLDQPVIQRVFKTLMFIVCCALVLPPCPCGPLAVVCAVGPAAQCVAAGSPSSSAGRCCQGLTYDGARRLCRWHQGVEGGG